MYALYSAFIIGHSGRILLRLSFHSLGDFVSRMAIEGGICSGPTSLEELCRQGRIRDPISPSPRAAPNRCSGTRGSASRAATCTCDANSKFKALHAATYTCNANPTLILHAAHAASHELPLALAVLGSHARYRGCGSARDAGEPTSHQPGGRQAGALRTPTPCLCRGRSQHGVLEGSCGQGIESLRMLPGSSKPSTDSVLPGMNTSHNTLRAR